METLAWIIFGAWVGSVVYRGYKYYTRKKQEKEIDWK